MYKTSNKSMEGTQDIAVGIVT